MIKQSDLLLFLLQGLGQAVERVLDGLKLIVEELIDLAKRIAVPHQRAHPLPAAFACHRESQGA
jgi:hypothetical protein